MEVIKNKLVQTEKIEPMIPVCLWPLRLGVTENLDQTWESHEIKNQ